MILAFDKSLIAPFLFIVLLFVGGQHAQNCVNYESFICTIKETLHAAHCSHGLCSDFPMLCLFWQIFYSFLFQLLIFFHSTGDRSRNLQEALVRGGSPYGKWCWAKQEGRNHGGRSRPQLNKCGFWGMNSGTHAYVVSNLQFPQLCFFLSYFKKYIIIWDRFSQGSPGCHGTPLCKPGNQHGSDFEVILLCQPHEFWDTGRCLLAWLT